jgi:hypothetical protein
VDEAIQALGCIDSGREPLCNLESARLALEVALAARDGSEWSR